MRSGVRTEGRNNRPVMRGGVLKRRHRKHVTNYSIDDGVKIITTRSGRKSIRDASGQSARNRSKGGST